MSWFGEVFVNGRLRTHIFGAGSEDCLFVELVLFEMSVMRKWFKVTMCNVACVQY